MTWKIEKLTAGHRKVIRISLDEGEDPERVVKLIEGMAAAQRPGDSEAPGHVGRPGEPRSDIEYEPVAVPRTRRSQPSSGTPFRTCFWTA